MIGKARSLFFSILAAGLYSGLGAPAGAEILTLYSDKGVPPGASVLAFSNPNTTPAFFQGDNTDLAAPEGLQAFKTQGVSWAGWGVIYNSGVNLTKFNAAGGGVLRFWLYSNSSDLTLSLEHTTPGLDCQGVNQIRGKDCWDFKGSQLGSNLNKWNLVQIPMFFEEPPGSGIFVPVRMDDLFSPFELTSNTGATFYVDDVRYVDNVLYTNSPDPTSAPIVFNATVKNISDQQVTSNLTWSGIKLPTGWARADQYIEVQVDPNAPGWGIQIYSDNTAPDANPQFVSATPSGQPRSNPAGLVDAGNPQATLPLAWSIKASAIAPSAADPTNAGDTNSFQWLLLQDKKTPAIASENTNAFTNGQAFSIVKDNLGIHFGQRDSDFGAETPPNFIFLESNFANAISPRVYKTSTLRLEFFYP